MSVSFRTVGGVRTGRYQTSGSRFGPGKVHRYIYLQDERRWAIACQRPGQWTWFGWPVGRDEVVTCKACGGAA